MLTNTSLQLFIIFYFQFYLFLTSPFYHNNVNLDNLKLRKILKQVNYLYFVRNMNSLINNLILSKNTIRYLQR